MLYNDKKIGRIKIPQRWKIVKLGTLIEAIKGKKPKYLFKEYKEELLPYLSAEYLRNKSIDKYVKISGEEVLVNKGDVVLLWDGSNAGEFFLGEKGVLSSTMVKLNLVEKDINKVYLYYVLKTKEKYLKSQTKGTGIPHVDKKILYNLKIPLPPLPEQQKIAEILSTVDQAIQKVDEAIEKTERFKKGLMEKLLTQGIGHEDFEDTEIGRIPKEWEVVRLIDVADYINGYAFSPRDWQDKGLPIIRIQNLTDKNAEFNYYGGHIDSKYIVNDEDILFSWSASIGVYIWDRGKGVLNQHIFKVVPKNNIDKLYLYYGLYLSIEQLKNKVHGSTMKHFKRKELETTKIPLPPLPEQQKITEILSTVDKKLELQRKRKKKLEKIKKGLMEDLLTGKRRVGV